MTEGREDVENLVTRARSGDLEAFEMLYRSHQAGIYTFIRSQIRNADAAADLTQETFVRAWESLPRLRKAGAFRGWLHQIAGNLVRDEVKSGRARLEVVESVLTGADNGTGYDLPEQASPDGTPESRLLEREQSEEIQAALQELSAEQRAAVVMHHMEGMGVNEIAAALGVRPGTIMSRLSRAREALRSRLSRYVEGSDE